MNTRKIALLLIFGLTIGFNNVNAVPMINGLDSGTIKRDPVLVDGAYVINREDWIHNYKIDIGPALCSEKNVTGFSMIFFKGRQKECEITVRAMVDLCMASKFKNAIPEVLQTNQEAYSSGVLLGQCIIEAYSQTKKK